MPDIKQQDPREMQAGPELDAAIAVDVFGWHWLQGYDAPYSAPHRFLAPPDREGTSASGNEPIRSQSCPAFSSDPAASAELKAKLWEMGFDGLEMDWYRSRVKTGENFANFTIGSRLIPRWIAVTATAVFTDDPRPAEFLAVARCALIAARARKAGAA